MITTTLNRIREHSPCEKGWEKLLKHLGKTQADDEPLPYSVIVESNGLDDALWCCRAEPQYAKAWRLFAVWCARQVQHLITDQRSINAMDVAERYANGNATYEELAAAAAAAWAVARSAAGSAAGAASGAAAAAAAATWSAARSAARAAAWSAAGAASGAAAAAAAATWSAARSAQEKKFLEVVGGA